MDEVMELVVQTYQNDPKSKYKSQLITLLHHVLEKKFDETCYEIVNHYKRIMSVHTNVGQEDKWQLLCESKNI